MAFGLAGSFHNPTSVQGGGYAATVDGELQWYRHDGREDGSMRWAANNGANVGHGWNFKQVFSADDGVIYAITGSGSSQPAPAPAPARPTPGPQPPPRKEQLPPPENPFCRNYAHGAVDDYKAMLKVPKCRVKSDGRWKDDYQSHYKWCLTAPHDAAINEAKERDKWLLKCGGHFSM